MVTHVFALPISVNASDPEAPVTAEVIPPPGEGGVLKAADGRRQVVRDATALASALNAQAWAVRLDRDHRSEPVSKTFEKSTEADGWLGSFRVNARGGIDAEFDLGEEARNSLRDKKYRYLSPAVLLDKADNVVGLSSVALVNNPNFLGLGAPAINSEQDVSKETKSTEEQLAEREARLVAREAEATKLLDSAAEQAVDDAIAAKRITPAQRDFFLGSIKSNAGGVSKGIEEFRAAIGDGGGTKTTLDRLRERTAPSGVPRSASPNAGPGGRVPPGWSPPSDERTELHARVAEHARARGISFRDALAEYGAIHGV